MSHFVRKQHTIRTKHTYIYVCFVALLLLVAFSHTAEAASTGAKFPTLGAGVSEAPWSDNDWVNPTNIYADDNSNVAEVTHATYDSGDQTFVLEASGFDFSSIPDGSQIDGVIVNVNGYYSAGGGSLDLCQLLSTGGSKVGTNNCSTPTALTTNTATIITKGGASDSFGNSLTASWVKDPDFGVALGVLATSNNTDVHIDYVSMEVYYTPPALTLSGTLYTDEGVSTSTGTHTIKVAVGTSTVSIHSTTTDAGASTWSLTIPSPHSIDAGVPIVVWVDASTTVRAAVVTKAEGIGDISGLDLYQNRVIVRHEAASEAMITNADMAFYDNEDDDGIQFDASSTLRSLEVLAGNELHIWSGSTFSPGGAVTVNGNAASNLIDGSLHLPSSSSNLDSNLIAYWDFEDGAGSSVVTDSSGNGKDGTTENLNTSTAWVDSKSGLGTAIQLEETNNEYISIPDESYFDFTGNQPFSISYWMKTPTQGGQWRTYVSKGDSAWTISQNNTTNEILVSVNTSGGYNTVESTATIDDDEWHHVVFVYDGGTTGSIYIDTTPDGENASLVTGTLTPNNFPVAIGYDEEQGDGTHFDGLLDEVRIYTRALTETDITDLYEFSYEGVTGMELGGDLTLAGSLRASSSVTFSNNDFATIFTATTSDKVIDGDFTGNNALGSTTFNGDSNSEWTFLGNASTTHLSVVDGTIVAPSGGLSFSGDFTNNGTFNANGGTLYATRNATQTISGTLTGTSALNDLILQGKGNKIFASSASTSDLIIDTAFFDTPTTTTSWDPADSNVIDGATDVKISGAYAYVVGYVSDNLAVVDISDPTNPTAVGNWKPDDTNIVDQPTYVDVYGDYAFVLNDGNNSMVVVDISDPTSPTTTGVWDPNDTSILDVPYSVVVSGNYAYVAGGNSDTLVVVDISDPTSPTTTGVWDPDDLSLMDGPRVITVSGNYAYVPGGTSDNMVIVDISDPTYPTTTGEWTPGDPNISNGTRAVTVDGDYAYVTGNSSDNMAIVDISNPASPSTVGNWDPNDTAVMDGARKALVLGDYAYVTGFLSSTTVAVDISNPASPTTEKIWGSNNPNTWLYYPVYDGKYLYVPSYSFPSSLFVIDMILGDGIAKAPSGGLSIAGDFINTNTFENNGGSLFISSSSAQTVTGLSNVTDLHFLGSGTKTLDSELTIRGDYTGSVSVVLQTGTTTFNGSSAQTLSGTMTGTSSFYGVHFEGGGSKIFGVNPASTTDFYIDSTSGQVTLPSSVLTIEGDYVNNSLIDNNSGTVYFDRDGSSEGEATTTVLTSGSSWNVPDDWNDSQNTIHVIGGGGNGADVSGPAGAGGGGGAYAVKSNISLTPDDDISYQVGGAGQDTWFSSSGFLMAKGGGGASGATPGTGGSAGSSIGDDTNSGGDGGANGGDSFGGGGGGGAAGPNGDGVAGQDGQAAFIGGDGGDGDNGLGGAGGGGGIYNSQGSVGEAGTEIAGGVGSGGGAGGASSDTGQVGVSGGNYGGGGGGDDNGGSGGSGAQGVVIITYTPSSGDVGTSTMVGTMTGTSAFNDVVFLNRGITEFSSDASTTDFTIASGTVAAPNSLNISGNYTNYGSFTAGSGTTTFDGASQQTATGTMTGTNAFSNVVVVNTSGSDAQSSPSLVFGAAASSSGNFVANQPGTKLQFAAGATTTFATTTFSGDGGDYVFLRSTESGTQWYIDVQSTSTADYVNVRDSNACGSTQGSIYTTNSIDSVQNNDCWDNLGTAGGGGDATISSAANQTFSIGGATTSISTITITDDITPAITAANDIRIAIATTTVDMVWDTSDVTATFGGTASDHVSNPVSYENDGSVLVIPVGTDFDASDTLTFDDLSFTQFDSINTAAAALGIRTDGAADNSDNATDDKTVTITGSLTLADHDSGQVSDNFTFPIDTEVPLYTFNATSSEENMTIPETVFTLSGIDGIETVDLTNAKLYRDHDDDKTFSAGDTQIGGVGAVSISDQMGTITFSTSYAATTTMNYVLIADVANIRPGDQMTVSFPVTNLTATGDTTSGTVVVAGSVSSIQHIRTPGGGSGGVGGGGATGNIETGGEEGGGGESGGDTGEDIGNPAGYFAPAANGTQYDEWTNPGNAYSADGSYATAGTANLLQTYGNFGFSIPGTDSIDGITVKFEAKGSAAGGTIEVALIGYSGTASTSVKTTATLTDSDVVYTLGSAGDTWSQSWSPSDFANSTFKVVVSAQPSGNTVQIDALKVKVNHVASGGGGGGGGAVFKQPDTYFANVYTAFVMAFGKSIDRVTGFMSGIFK